MGAAALRHVEMMVEGGSKAKDALSLAVGSMVFDCLQAVLPAEAYDGRQSYLVNRVTCVLDALDGDGWSLLTEREMDVVLCIRSVLRDPYAWDADEWERRLSEVIEPYRAAVRAA